MMLAAWLFAAVHYLPKVCNPDTGVAKTEFLATKCIDDPCGANAEVITDHMLDTLKECN